MVHTKKIMRDAFWEILEEKPYNKITVQDIPMLMTDSIEDWMSDVIQKYGTYESPVDCLTYMAQECMKRRKAFWIGWKKMLLMTWQNSTMKSAKYLLALVWGEAPGQRHFLPAYNGKTVQNMLRDRSVNHRILLK